MFDLAQKKEELQKLKEKLTVLKSALFDAEHRVGNMTSNDVYQMLRTQKINAAQAEEMEKFIAVKRDYPELIRSTEQWCKQLNREIQDLED